MKWRRRREKQKEQTCFHFGFPSASPLVLMVIHYLSIWEEWTRDWNLWRGTLVRPLHPRSWEIFLPKLSNIFLFLFFPSFYFGKIAGTQFKFNLSVIDDARAGDWPKVIRSGHSSNPHLIWAWNIRIRSDGSDWLRFLSTPKLPALNSIQITVLISCLNSILFDNFLFHCINFLVISRDKALYVLLIRYLSIF